MGKRAINCMKDAEKFLEDALATLNKLSEQLSALNNAVLDLNTSIEYKLTELSDAVYEEKERKNS